MLKPRIRTETRSKSYRTALGHTRYPPVREVDLEPTGKRGNERALPLWPTTDRLEAYSSNWSSTQKHTQQPWKTLSKRLEICEDSTWFPKIMLFSISNKAIPELLDKLEFLTVVISGFVTPKDKTKSNPLTIQNSQAYHKVCTGSSLSQCHERELSLPKIPAKMHGNLNEKG